MYYSLLFLLLLFPIVTSYPSTPPHNNYRVTKDSSDEYTPYPRGPPYYDPYPPPNKDRPENSRNLGLQLGLGIGIGFSILIALIAIGVYFCIRRRRRLNNNKLFPISLNRENTYVKQDNSPAISSNDPWELDRSNIIVNYDKKLGSGAFCNVFHGSIIGEAPVSRVFPGVRTSTLKNCEVAIKMLPSFADDIARSDFMQEINFMKSLAYHPHLVSMLGYVDDRKSPYLLVEYCERGDLLHYIRDKKDEIRKGLTEPGGLKIKDLLSFSWQISNGLEYLNSVGCIHRDIAARNILVDGQKQCKIGDFGLCRLTDSLLYTARGGRLPLKWMAIESLMSYEYSFKSDVWSYGVVLWELFSLGEVPYNNIQTTDLLEHLQKGERLTQPECCTDEMYELMQLCWKYQSRDRPTFRQLCLRLASLLEKATESYGYLIPRSSRPAHVQCDNV